MAEGMVTNSFTKYFFMKWTISQEEFNKLTPAEQKFFTVKKVEKKKGGGGYGAVKPKKVPWVSHGDLPKLGRRVRRKYEIFCGGFLYFYDKTLMDYLKEVNGKVKGAGNKFLTYFKGKSFNHTMTFEWGADKEKPGRRRVTIYLSPPAGNPDPPTTPSPPPPETSN
jgi:hypothetical protein